MAGVSYVDLPGFIDQVDRRGLCAASMVPILTLRSEPSPRKSSPSIRLNRPERSSEVGAVSSDRSSLATMRRLVVPNPSFPTLSDQKGDDREGSDAVDPPRAEKPLSDQAQQHHGATVLNWHWRSHRRRARITAPPRSYELAAQWSPETQRRAGGRTSGGTAARRQT
jgi:hypothetical protein